MFRHRLTVKLEPGQSETVEVFARDPWNETGIYLEAGEYTFKAEGEWVDLNIPSDPGGTRGFFYWLRPRETFRNVATLLGKAEMLYSRVVRDENVYFPLARREPDVPWMSLVGYVANDAVTVNGKPNTGHERIAIGDVQRVRSTRST